MGPCCRHECYALAKAYEVQQRFSIHILDLDFRIRAVVGDSPRDVVMHLRTGGDPRHDEMFAMQIRPIELTSSRKGMLLHQRNIYPLAP